jgi:2-polyprenyl-3-methyl-5-hydroxy-6-metoxy-1,4-benzoquinol methylase
VATDIETHRRDSATHLEVRHHTVGDGMPDARGYDLIHARFVLDHLPQQASVLSKLAAALRPAGHLVIEDHDRCTGSDEAPGQHLPHLLRDVGLTEVTSEAMRLPCTPILVSASGRRPTTTP